MIVLFYFLGGPRLECIMQPTRPGFPKLCALKETEVCRQSFIMLWQKAYKMFGSWSSRFWPS